MSHTKIGSCDSLNFFSVLLFSNILWKKKILWITINASLLLPTWAGMHTELILSVFVGLTSSTNSNGMTGHYCICKFHTFNGKNEAPVNWENDWSLLADINWNKELKSFQLQLFFSSLSDAVGSQYFLSLHSMFHFLYSWSLCPLPPVIMWCLHFWPSID